MDNRFGIYLNPERAKVVRITSPYWFPPEPPWVFLTPDVNCTLLEIRRLAKTKKLVRNEEQMTWDSLPYQPEKK